MGDWQGYEALAFDVDLAGDQPLDVVVKIVDRAHDGSYEDRFHGYATLVPGRNVVRFALEDVAKGPQSRRLDLGRVAAVQLFVDGLEAKRLLYLDHVRLLRGE